jgi:neopullulanase
MDIVTPEWVRHAVFYQIFPDRFSRSPRTQHPRGLRFTPWGSPPQPHDFQGGDLRGIVDRLDYLQDLGITALYLTPIFSSASNHRYHTYDYLEVDPLLGGNDALRELLDEAHARDMRVVLDGVFNHASRGLWAFHHILENGPDSPYIDWFIIHGWPLRPYSSDKHHPPNYEAWWSLPALPKLNTRNPGVRDMIMHVARHWIEFGIDGWRLDVPTEIDDDSFWQEFRRVVRSANPEAYIVGEIWSAAHRWLQGDQFDAVMNYPLMGAAINFFGAKSLNAAWHHRELAVAPLDSAAFAARVDEIMARYDPAITYVQLNLIGSHDTPRALWLMGGDRSALRLAALFQMTMPGAPCVYYGDEIGLTGGPDPGCRAAFPWHDEPAWDRDLLDFYRAAIALRRRYPVLRTGTFEPLPSPAETYAFRRVLDGQQAVVAFNAGMAPAALDLAVPAAQDAVFEQVWPAGAALRAAGGRLSLTVPAREAVVLIGG